MRKPFLHALGAAGYIVTIVIVINVITRVLKDGQESILIPMTMLGLFVFSAAVMGYFFLSEPLVLLTENRRSDAILFFGRTVAVFACFLAVFITVLLLGVGSGYSLFK